MNWNNNQSSLSVFKYSDAFKQVMSHMAYSICDVEKVIIEISFYKVIGMDVHTIFCGVYILKEHYVNKILTLEASKTPEHAWAKEYIKYEVFNNTTDCKDTTRREQCFVFSDGAISRFKEICQVDNSFNSRLKKYDNNGIPH